MEIITLDRKACEKHGFSPGEILMLMACGNTGNPGRTMRELVEKGLLSAKRDDSGGYFLTEKGNDLLTDILTSKPGESSLISLAKKMKEIYPKGTKVVGDKAYYWTDSPKLIERRLKVFFKLYGEYPEEEILDATRRYVRSFHGDHETMKLLKYFIFREKGFGTGLSDPSSDLLNFLENKEEMTNGNWNIEIL